MLHFKLCLIIFLRLPNADVTTLFKKDRKYNINKINKII